MLALPLPVRPSIIEGVKVRDVIEANGWRLRATRGSHRQYLHPQKGQVVTVAGHLNRDIPIGTLKAIFRSAALDANKEDK